MNSVRAFGIVLIICAALFIFPAITVSMRAMHIKSEWDVKKADCLNNSTCDYSKFSARMDEAVNSENGPIVVAMLGMAVFAIAGIMVLLRGDE